MIYGCNPKIYGVYETTGNPLNIHPGVGAGSLSVLTMSDVSELILMTCISLTEIG